MNKLFAKLFTLSDGRQVLVTREYNNEDRTFDVKKATEIDGDRITVTHQFEVESDCDMEFDAHTEEAAEQFYAAVVAKLNEMAG